MPKAKNNNNKENEKVVEIDPLDDFLGTGEVTGEEGSVIDTGATEPQPEEGSEGSEAKEIAEEVKISKAELIKQIKANPELIKEITGIAKTNNIKPDGLSEIDKLTSIVATLAQSIAQGQQNAGRPVSNELQTILARAERQAMANIENYKKKFSEEVKKGQVGELLIYGAYGKRLPTRSMKVQNADGTSTNKVTKFEIGFRGVLLSFELGKKYIGVPNSIINFMNRKIASYQDVVKGSGSTKIAEQAFDISKNAAS